MNWRAVIAEALWDHDTEFSPHYADDDYRNRRVEAGYNHRQDYVFHPKGSNPPIYRNSGIGTGQIETFIDNATGRKTAVPHLSVHSDHQHRGIGRQWFEYVHKWAHDNGHDFKFADETANSRSHKLTTAAGAGLKDSFRAHQGRS